jgi:hypothetical protein
LPCPIKRGRTISTPLVVSSTTVPMIRAFRWWAPQNFERQVRLAIADDHAEPHYHIVDLEHFRVADAFRTPDQIEYLGYGRQFADPKLDALMAPTRAGSRA